MTDLTRLKQLLAKAEKDSVEYQKAVREGRVEWVSIMVFKRAENPLNNAYEVSRIAPAQFAQLKIDYADRFKGEV